LRRFFALSATIEAEHPPKVRRRIVTVRDGRIGAHDNAGEHDKHQRKPDFEGTLSPVRFEGRTYGIAAIFSNS
jgi:hypothetical protein